MRNFYALKPVDLDILYNNNNNNNNSNNDNNNNNNNNNNCLFKLFAA